MSELSNLVKKSIFKQELHRKIYDYSFEHYPSICYSKQKINELEVFTCNLEMPLLEVDEEFYIEELNKIVKVNRRVRTSKENVCYYVQPEIIEDEESIRTKELAEQYKLNYKADREDYNKLFTHRNELINREKQYKDIIKELSLFKGRVQDSFWYRFIK